MRNRAVVISLQRRREQKEMDAVLRVIRRAMGVPDYLIEDVLGTDPAWDRDEHDDAVTVDRLNKATGLRWPAPGLADRVVRERR